MLHATFIRLLVLFTPYYMAGSPIGQNEANPVFWLATRVGKISLSCLLRISCFVPTKAKFFGIIFWPYNKSFIDQAFVFCFFCIFMYLDFISVHKKAKKKNWLNISSHLDLTVSQFIICQAILKAKSSSLIGYSSVGILQYGPLPW